MLTVDPARSRLLVVDSHGAEIVTTETVVFEWLATAEQPQFRQAVALVK
jgi:hypothetical protein